MSSPNCDNIHPSDEVKYKGYTCTVLARHCDKNTVDLELDKLSTITIFLYPAKFILSTTVLISPNTDRMEGDRGLILSDTTGFADEMEPVDHELFKGGAFSSQTSIISKKMAVRRNESR